MQQLVFVKPQITGSLFALFFFRKQATFSLVMDEEKSQKSWHWNESPIVKAIAVARGLLCFPIGKLLCSAF